MLNSSVSASAGNREQGIVLPLRRVGILGTGTSGEGGEEEPRLSRDRRRVGAPYQFGQSVNQRGKEATTAPHDLTKTQHHTLLTELNTLSSNFSTTKLTKTISSTI